MKRRGFFGLLAAGVGAVALTGRKAAASVGLVPCERDLAGRAVARCYTQSPGDGKWREVPRQSLKKGDRVIMVGIDGDRLFMCTAFEADSDYQPPGVHDDALSAGSILLLEEVNLLGSGFPAPRS